MTLVAASGHLMTRGYDCQTDMAETMIKNKVVTPEDPNALSLADVNAIAEHLENCGVYTPGATLCKIMGCTYADYLRSLQAAAERESLKYGQEVPAIERYFAMHRQPPHFKFSEGGKLMTIPAAITFTLSDDVLGRIEDGDLLL
jgi:hypothetical protein